MDKVTVSIVKNPFDILQERLIDNVDYAPGMTAADCIAQLGQIDLDQFVLLVNGIEAPTDTIVQPWDYVSAVAKVESGDSNSILAMVAMIALTIYTGGLYAGWVAAGTNTYLATAGMVGLNLVGSYLIYHWLPMQTDSYQGSNTYGWDGIKNSYNQGASIPILFGEMRVGGQVLSSHPTTDGDKQYANLLFCGGEGPCDYTGDGEDGNCTGITDITINDNPFENFSGDLVAYKRAGLNGQSVIPGFNETYADQAISHKCELGIPYIVTTDGNAATALEVCFDFPGGISFTNLKGEFKSSAIGLSLFYRVHGAAQWTNYNGAVYSGTQVSANEFRTAGYIGIGVNDVITIGGGVYQVVSNIEEGEWIGGEWSGYGTYIITVDGPSLPAGSLSFKTSHFAYSGKTKSALKRVLRLDNLTKGQYYDVAVSMYQIADVNNPLTVVAYWSMLTQVSEGALSRPNKVLLGIKALATDQLSGGMPTITWLQKRSKVIIQTGVGTYTEKPADNPAWACYWLLNRVYRYKNIHTNAWEYVVKGLPYDQIDYDRFEAWAAFCDDKGCHVNIYLDTPDIVWDALVKVSRVGYGQVFPSGGDKWSCVYDGPTDMIAGVVNRANMVRGSFSEQFISSDDMANAVEVTFFNAAKNYERDKLTVYADGYNDSDTIQKPVGVDLVGCTSADEAYAYGNYLLKCTKYNIRTCSWSQDIDSIGYMIGDVVMVQHDVPRWGSGGRVIAADEYTITLDHEVIVDPGKTYAVRVQLPDDTIFNGVIGAGIVTAQLGMPLGVQPLVGGSSTVLVSDTPFETIPAPGSLWQFGEYGRVAKPFRIAQISRDSDLRRKISAVEYNEAAYEPGSPPAIDYSSGLGNITGLIANQYNDESGVAWIGLAWMPPRDMYAGAIVSVNGKQIGKVDQSQNSLQFPVIDLGTYAMTVAALDRFGNAFGAATVEYEVTDNPPPLAPEEYAAMPTPKGFIAAFS